MNISDVHINKSICAALFSQLFGIINTGKVSYKIEFKNEIR